VTLARTLASLAVLLSALLLVGSLAMLGTAGAAEAVETPGGNDTDGPRPGERLAGVVGVEGAAVGGDIDEGRFAAALANASTDRATVRVIDRRLVEVDRLLDRLDRRTRRLERARANGFLQAGRYAARAADLAARLRSVERVLDRTESVTDGLPADRRAEIEDRVQRLRERRLSLLDDDLAAAARTVDGADVEGDASPVDLRDVVAAYERSGGNAPGVWTALFGTEQIAVHVERANGRTAVFGLHTDGGDVVEAVRGPPEDPTVRVDTDYAVVRRVAGAENPWTTASRALAEDRITYRGLGVVSGVKYGLLAALLFLYDGLYALVTGGLDLLGDLFDAVVDLL